MTQQRAVMANSDKASAKNHNVTDLTIASGWMFIEMNSIKMYQKTIHHA